MLDVFAVNEGEPRWLDCAETMGKALLMILTRGNGSYMLFSPQNGHKDLYEVNNGILSRVSRSSQRWLRRREQCNKL
jgi:hypothetical protein